MQYEQNRQRFWRRHPWLVASTLLGGLWLVAHADRANYPVIVVFALATVYLIVRRRRRARAITRAGLSARADLEHRLMLRGDPRGIFGRFPPQRAGWFPDPARAGTPDIRYFDGVAWTGHTASPPGSASSALLRARGPATTTPPGSASSALLRARGPATSIPSY